MRIKILGGRYKFLIKLELYDKDFSFEILSLYTAKNQRSAITNLNFIIAELIFPVIETTDIDTTIFLNKTSGIKLFQESILAFKNKYWINLLEEKLDEDRNYGGWNSNFEI
ncbi:MAG: hypothetical protein K9J16_00195 [Melioribacteraceae bacterium]|nr:hypothetical protein [Melioribacteraceae bacterium]MCF8353929.1 hypothetical protein [Melioribacteraceae bacterium]MCF8392686.1 hypothetical protein [Melioribacteraceae bacterium]MCF8417707.1 hypothetical protein [Melioribacteraceae bacterium]